MSQLYMQVAEVIEKWITKKGGLKTLAFAKTVRQNAAVYSLSAETLKYKPTLEALLQSAGAATAAHRLEGVCVVEDDYCDRLRGALCCVQCAVLCGVCFLSLSSVSLFVSTPQLTHTRNTRSHARRRYKNVRAHHRHTTTDAANAVNSGIGMKAASKQFGVPLHDLVRLLFWGAGGIMVVVCCSFFTLTPPPSSPSLRARRRHCQRHHFDTEFDNYY